MEMQIIENQISKNDIEERLKQLLERLKQIDERLKQLQENKNGIYAIPMRELRKEDISKATSDIHEKMKLTCERIELRHLIDEYQIHLRKNSYKEGTDPFVEDLKDPSNIPQFSWGIIESDPVDKPIIFEQSEEGKEYIRVTNHGRFRYLNGKSDVPVGRIETGTNTIIAEVQAVKTENKTIIQAEDIKTLLTQHPEFFAETLNLIAITKGKGDQQSSYLVLSPIGKEQLTDENIRSFFISEYCSDEYLKSVTTAENGLYAGNIKSEEGSCRIVYEETSVRAAKLAEYVPGTTLKVFDMGNGDIRKHQGSEATFEEMRGYYERIEMEGFRGWGR